jgi:hypothetical protein
VVREPAELTTLLMVPTRRSKRKSTVNIARATDAEMQRMREKRISRLESDATEDVVADDGDDDFEVRRPVHCGVRPAGDNMPCLRALQGSDSDGAGKKRKTKRRSTRTKGAAQGQGPINLSKNFSEVSSRALGRNHGRTGRWQPGLHRRRSHSGLGRARSWVFVASNCVLPTRA